MPSLIYPVAECGRWGCRCTSKLSGPAFQVLNWFGDGGSLQSLRLGIPPAIGHKGVYAGGGYWLMAGEIYMTISSRVCDTTRRAGTTTTR